MSNQDWGNGPDYPNQQNPGQYPGQDGSYAPGNGQQGSAPGYGQSQWQPNSDQGGYAGGGYDSGSYGSSGYGGNYGNTGEYGSAPQYAPGGGQSAFGDGQLGDYNQARPGFVGDWETGSVQDSGKKKSNRIIWVAASIVAVIFLAIASVGGVFLYKFLQNSRNDPGAGGGQATQSPDPTGGQPTSQPSAPPSGQPTQASGGNLGTSGAAGEFADWAISQFGDFETLEFSGDGNDIVDIPDGIKDAILTVEYNGDRVFSLKSLDANNQESYQVGTSNFGKYKTTELVNFDEGSSLKVDRLAIEASGDWKVTVAAVATAQEFADSGEGGAVVQYMGQAKDFELTHDGESNFIVWQHTGKGFNRDLLVNEIGKWDGDVEFAQGPSLLSIQADGKWTIKEK